VVSRENWEGSKSVLVADEDFDPTTTTAAAAGNREAVVVFVVVVLRVECEDVGRRRRRGFQPHDVFGFRRVPTFCRLWFLSIQ
jgi:hypothetical protein